MTDSVDVPCCCDCGTELGSDYAERDVTERDPWHRPDPITDTTVVELICLDCAGCR